MKRLHLFLFLSIASLFAIGCERDEMDNGGEKTFNSFRVEMPAMRTDNKAYVDFAAEISQILYEDGDVIYVNHQPFTLHKTSDHWVAEASTAVSAEVFYCCHASGGTVTLPDGAADDGPMYRVNFSNTSNATGLVLAGSTTSNVLTFENPPFAVLVLKDPTNAYSSVKVGFDGSKIPALFTVSASDQSFSNINFMPTASSSTAASLLTMKKPAGKDYFYIAVPLDVDGEKSTKLYLQYETPNGTPVQRVTSDAVSLQRGHVYVLPSEDMSEYPFDADGASRYKYSVASNKQVRFSAGNLQFNPRLYTWNGDSKKSWRFATYQYDKVAATANVSLASTNNYYMDLFAWGTSGEDNWGLDPYDRDDNSADYGNGADDLGDLDWGHVNTQSGDKYGIYYGSRRTTLTWRTLTNSEWSYLINRQGKVGYAMVMNVKGMIILPDNWTLPEGLSFSTSSLNTYSNYEDWRKMEKNGAIFLPACGFRNSPTATSASGVPGASNEGYYWSSTHDDVDMAYYLTFNCNNRTKGTLSEERKFGMSVRLVTENGVSSAL